MKYGTTVNTSRKWVNKMVRKIKQKTDEEVDALTNPKRAGRKYRQALGKALAENNLTFEDFRAEPVLLNKKYIDDSTVFTLFISKEMLEKSFVSLEKIMVGLLNEELIETFPEERHVRSIEAKFEFTDYDIKDVVFFETMLASPNNQKMFEKMQKVVSTKTNIRERLKKIFPKLENKIDEYVDEFFSEEFREIIIGWHNEIIAATRDFSTLSDEEIKEKYLIVEKDSYIISSLDDEIWVKFLGYEHETKAYFFDISYGGEEKANEINKKISESMDKNCWTINGKFCIKKEWIEFLTDLIKEARKNEVSGFLEYFPQIKKKDFTVKRVKHGTNNFNAEEKKKEILNPIFLKNNNKTNILLLEYHPNENSQNKIQNKSETPSDFNSDENVCIKNEISTKTEEKKVIEVSMSETLCQEIKNINSEKKSDIETESLEKSESLKEDIYEKEPEILLGNFVPEKLESSIDLAWYEDTANNLSFNQSELEDFNLYNARIESIVKLIKNKRM